MFLLIVRARGNSVQSLAALQHVVELEGVVGHSQISVNLFPAFVVVQGLVVPLRRVLLEPAKRKHQRWGIADASRLIVESCVRLEEGLRLLQNALAVPPDRRTARYITIESPGTREQSMQSEETPVRMAVQGFPGNANLGQPLSNRGSHGTLDEVEELVRSAVAFDGSCSRGGQVETASLRIVELALFQRIADCDDDAATREV